MFDRATPDSLLFSPQQVKYFSNSMATFFSQVCGYVAERPDFFFFFT